MAQITIKDVNGKSLYTGEHAGFVQALSAAMNQHVNLAGADLSGQNLTGVDFSAAPSLVGAKLDRAILTNCNFTGVDLRNVSAAAAAIAGAKFHQADMRGMNTKGWTGQQSADFSRARFTP